MMKFGPFYTSCFKETPIIDKKTLMKGLQLYKGTVGLAMVDLKAQAYDLKRVQLDWWATRRSTRSGTRLATWKMTTLKAMVK